MMIVYTVTVHVPAELADDWRQWMTSKHIPDVLASLQWEDATLHEQLDPTDEGCTIFVVRYRTTSMERYTIYRTNHAPALQADHTARYGDRVTASRTVSQEIACLTHHA